MTTELFVRTPGHTYPVVVGRDLIDDIARRFKMLGIETTRPLFLITDENVASLEYHRRMVESCEAEGYAIQYSVVPPTDASKSLQVAEHLFEEMVKAGLRRDGIVVALGGGMIGDLAGFVASTYYRGIPFLQVPTTLLAHDSSIGGKVAVNLASGKNLVGAFHQPLAVLYDVQTLASLPEREWKAGMAEVIKHGLIGNKDLFMELLANPRPQYPGAFLAEAMIAKACTVKISIVEQDEREQGERMKLNVGHTVGHAVEQYSEYQLNHGECVSIGIVVEAELATERGLLSEEDRDQITLAFQRHGLPTQTPNYPIDPLLEYLSRDKKHAHGGWTMALPTSIGDVTIARDITSDEVRQAWQSVQNRNGGLIG